MGIEIIFQGKVPDKWKCTCDNCRTIFTFEEEDTINDPDEQHTVKCPTCGQIYFVSNCEPMDMPVKPKPDPTGHDYQPY